MDNEMNMSMFTTPNNFQYSAIEIDNLDCDSYTIVNVLVDTTSSIFGFEDKLESCLKEILDSCKKHPRAENLLLRVAYFNSRDGIVEAHGFTLIETINGDDYKIVCNGCTPLYDAALDCIETTEAHAKTLSDQEYSSNGIFFILTDGEENSSRTQSASAVKDALNALRKSEHCESIKAFLVGINDDDPGVKSALSSFEKEVKFDDYIKLGDATSSKLAKLAQWISQSISSQSQAINSGQSQNINFNL